MQFFAGLTVWGIATIAGSLFLQRLALIAIGSHQPPPLSKWRIDPHLLSCDDGNFGWDHIHRIFNADAVARSEYLKYDKHALVNAGDSLSATLLFLIFMYREKTMLPLPDPFPA